MKEGMWDENLEVKKILGARESKRDCNAEEEHDSLLPRFLRPSGLREKGKGERKAVESLGMLERGKSCAGK